MTLADGKTVALVKPLIIGGTPITDAMRQIPSGQFGPIDGDGRQWPDSSYGSWDAEAVNNGPYTNVCENGGFESNTNGWGAIRASVLTRINTDAKFGSWCLDLVNDGTQALQGAQYVLPTAQTNGVTYMLSGWVKSISGSTAIMLSISDNVTDTNQVFTLAPYWQRFRLSKTWASSLAGAFRFFINGTAAAHYLIDGIQFERSRWATPYIETNGAAASRNSSSIVMPYSYGLFDPTRGWWAVRCRPGFDSTATPVGAGLIKCRNGTPLVSIDHYNSQWRVQSRATTNVDGAFSSATFSPGSTHTIIGQWTPQTLYNSVNGAAFVTVARTDGVPYLAGTDIQIGWAQNANFNGDLLWVAGGNGTLSNADAAAINGFGDVDKLPKDFPASGQCTWVWQCNSPYIIVAA